MSSWGLFGRRVTNARKNAATASLTTALTKLLSSVRTLQNTNINRILSKTPNNSRQFLRSVVAYILAVNRVKVANKAVDKALLHVSNGQPESAALSPVKAATNANLAAALAAKKVAAIKNSVSINGRNVSIIKNTSGKWVFGNNVNSVTRMRWNIRTNNSGGAYVVSRSPPPLPPRPGPLNAQLRKYLADRSNASPQLQIATINSALRQGIKNQNLFQEAKNRLAYLRTLKPPPTLYVPPKINIG